MGQFKNIAQGLLIFGIVLFGGAYLYSYIEGLSFFDSIYNIFLTITTVGAVIPPQTNQGIILLMFIIFIGMGTAIYIATLIARTVIEGQTSHMIRGIRGGIKMRSEKNHVIVCGYGNLGKSVCEVLKQNKKKYLILDNDPQVIARLVDSGEAAFEGDALDADILKKVGVQKAKSVIGTLSSDADNIYLVMTASELNPDLLIAAEAKSENAVKRLHRIGAQIVVMPQVVGGKQLANAVLEVEKTNEMSSISKKS